MAAAAPAAASGPLRHTHIADLTVYFPAKEAAPQGYHVLWKTVTGQDASIGSNTDAYLCFSFGTAASTAVTDVAVLHSATPGFELVKRTLHGTDASLSKKKVYLAVQRSPAGQRPASAPLAAVGLILAPEGMPKNYIACPRAFLPRGKTGLTVAAKYAPVPSSPLPANAPLPWHSPVFHLTNGDEAFADSNLGLGHEHYRTAVALDRASDVPLGRLSNLELRTGDVTAALNSADRALALNPRSAIGYVSKACALEELGRRENTQGRAPEAGLDRKIGHIAGAVACFAEACKVDRNPQGPHIAGYHRANQALLVVKAERAAIHVKNGDRAVNLRHFSSAAEHFAKAVNLVPQDVAIRAKFDSAKREHEAISGPSSLGHLIRVDGAASPTPHGTMRPQQQQQRMAPPSQQQAPRPSAPPSTSTLGGLGSAFNNMCMGVNNAIVGTPAPAPKRSPQVQQHVVQHPVQPVVVDPYFQERQSNYHPQQQQQQQQLRQGSGGPFPPSPGYAHIAPSGASPAVGAAGERPPRPRKPPAPSPGKAHAPTLGAEGEEECLYEITYDANDEAYGRWELPRDAVSLGAELGKGAFGRVYKGEVTHANVNVGKPLPVAIKTLQDDSPDMLAEFRHEAGLLTLMTHRHVMGLVGMCTLGTPFLLVCECFDRGDLRSVLRSSRAGGDKAEADLTMIQLLQICIQCAAGLQYICEEQKIVHRDIAARNCLCGTDPTMPCGLRVVIADFGLSRAVGEIEGDYYRRKTRRPLPVKWMAPECLTDGVFTAKSDLFSFGVLMWECFTMGQAPWADKRNQDVRSLLKRNERMEIPDDCPQPIYDIMLKTWEYDPAKRPTFSETRAMLVALLQDKDSLLQDDDAHAFYFAGDQEEEEEAAASGPASKLGLHGRKAPAPPPRGGAPMYCEVDAGAAPGSDHYSDIDAPPPQLGMFPPQMGVSGGVAAGKVQVLPSKPVSGAPLVGPSPAMINAGADNAYLDV